MCLSSESECMAPNIDIVPQDNKIINENMSEDEISSVGSYSDNDDCNF